MPVSNRAGQELAWRRFLALALWRMLQGGLDVAMNTQAATIERLAQAPIYGSVPRHLEHQCIAGSHDRCGMCQYAY
jgi:hypothetical protein